MRRVHEPRLRSREAIDRDAQEVSFVGNLDRQSPGDAMNEAAVAEFDRSELRQKRIEIEQALGRGNTRSDEFRRHAPRPCCRSSRPREQSRSMPRRLVEAAYFLETDDIRFFDQCTPRPSARATIRVDDRPHVVWQSAKLKVVNTIVHHVAPMCPYRSRSKP